MDQDVCTGGQTAPLAGRDQVQSIPALVAALGGIKRKGKAAVSPGDDAGILARSGRKRLCFGCTATAEIYRCAGQGSAETRIYVHHTERIRRIQRNSFARCCRNDAIRQALPGHAQIVDVLYQLRRTGDSGPAAQIR